MPHVDIENDILDELIFKFVIKHEVLSTKGTASWTHNGTATSSVPKSCRIISRNGTLNCSETMLKFILHGATIKYECARLPLLYAVRCLDV